MEWGINSSRRSFPRKRESSPTTAHFRRFAGWIPAFAGMTMAWNAHVSQMTPVPGCARYLCKLEESRIASFARPATPAPRPRLDFQTRATRSRRPPDLLVHDWTLHCEAVGCMLPVGLKTRVAGPGRGQPGVAAGFNLRIAKPTRPRNPDGVDPTNVRLLQGRNDLAVPPSVGFIPRGGTTHGMPLRGTGDAATERRAQGAFEVPQGTKERQAPTSSRGAKKSRSFVRLRPTDSPETRRIARFH